MIVETKPGYVEYLYDFYLPDNSLIVLDGATISGVNIPGYISTVIFEDASNPVDVEQHIATINLKNFSVLSGLYFYYKIKPVPPNVQFFPFWAMWMSDPRRGMFEGDFCFSNQPKKYLVSCLNGTVWNHRKFVYLELKNKPYFNNMVFSFGNRLDPHHITLEGEMALTITEQEEFKKLPNPVSFIDDDTTIGIDLNILHPAYQHTYINLVTETMTRESTPMLSEKTFKPIIAGQLFVLISSPNAIQFLREIGIDTFDDIIDHSYDKIVDTRQRVLAAIAEVDRLVTLDLEMVFDQIKPRLERNSIYFKSEQFRQQFKLTF